MTTQTREQVIEWAREAGIETVIGTGRHGALERFAALVAEHNREEYQSDLAEALMHDCENGVRLLNEVAHREFNSRYPNLAAAISARKEQNNA